MPSRSASAIKSIETTFEILDLIGNEGKGVTDIADELNVAKSTVHRHLTTLVKTDAVTKKDEQYHINTTMLTYGEDARSRFDIYPLANPVVDSLAEETNEGTALAVLQSNRVAYLYRSWGPHEVNIDLSLGHPYQELHCSAAGKALLASFSPDQTAEVLETIDLPRYTENTITDPDGLLSEVEHIREEGVAFDAEERYEGVRSAAKAIQDRETGRTLGALAVYGPSIRIDDEMFHQEIPTLLRRAASLVEINYANGPPG